MKRRRESIEQSNTDLAAENLADQPMTREEVLAMRGAEAIGEIPAREGGGVPAE